MKEYSVFPRDFGTLNIINEIEEYLGLEHKNINQISNFKLHEYINQLTLRLAIMNAC